MLILYRLLAALVSPLALWRLHRPARSVAGFRGRWRERLGSITPCQPDSIWIHGASVGEINAAQALIRQLKRDHPGQAVLVSTFTVTGAQRVAELFGDSVEHRFAPLDNWLSTRRWLRAARPARMIMIETEIWPELYLQAHKFGLSPILVNARLTERSLHKMQRFAGLYRPAVKAIGSAICQSELDARRFRALGLSGDQTPVAGNLKFDIPLAEDLGARANALRQRWGARPVWVAGSTREGEESIILTAHRRLIKEWPDALLVLAPRHPERTAEVATLIEQSRLKVAGMDDEVDMGTSVVLIDRLGQLMPCYAAAMVAFVGGSLVPIGGHNLLEPASLGKAVVAGHHLHEQAEPAHALEQAGGLLKVADANELARSVAQLWGDPEYALRIGRAALSVVEAGRGSLRRTLRLLSATTD